MPSIWDTFTHPYPSTGKRTTTDGLSEDDAADYFNEWKEKIALLKLYLAIFLVLDLGPAWTRRLKKASTLPETY